MTTAALRVAAEEAARNPAFAARLREAYQEGAPKTSAQGGAKSGTPRASSARQAEAAKYRDVAPVARLDSQLSFQRDPTDPVEAWQRFGGTRASVRSALTGSAREERGSEPLGAIEAMARRVADLTGTRPPRIVQSGNRAQAHQISTGRLADYIAEQMDAYHRGR